MSRALDWIGSVVSWAIRLGQTIRMRVRAAWTERRRQQMNKGMVDRARRAGL